LNLEQRRDVVLETTLLGKTIPPLLAAMQAKEGPDDAPSADSSQQEA
jgi:hypothetical protein